MPNSSGILCHVNKQKMYYLHLMGQKKDSEMKDFKGDIKTELSVKTRRLHRKIIKAGHFAETRDQVNKGIISDFFARNFATHFKKCKGKISEQICFPEM